jgi:hypothetical protein
MGEGVGDWSSDVCSSDLKKRMVLVKKGDQIKVVHYGAQGYKHNYSSAAKKSYLARSAGIRNKAGELTKDDIFSPNYHARRDLWDSAGRKKSLT